VEEQQEPNLATHISQVRSESEGKAKKISAEVEGELRVNLVEDVATAENILPDLLLDNQWTTEPVDDVDMVLDYQCAPVDDVDMDLDNQCEPVDDVDMDLDNQCEPVDCVPTSLHGENIQEFLTRSSPDIFDNISPQRTSPNKQDINISTTPKTSIILEENISPTLIERSPEILDSSFLYDSAMYDVLRQYDASQVKNQQSCHKSTSSTNAEPCLDSWNDSLFEFAFSSSLLEQAAPIDSNANNLSPNAQPSDYDACEVLAMQLEESDGNANNISPHAQPSDYDACEVLAMQLEESDEELEEEEEKLEIVMLDHKEVFIKFCKEWKTKGKHLSLSVACERCEAPIIGANIVGDAAAAQTSSPQIYDSASEYTNMKLAGVAICWGGFVSYYLNLRNAPGMFDLSNTLLILRNVVT
jgi:hypothetical protein